MTQCTLPPPGWYCTRPNGHTGPCAAHPVNDAQRIAAHMRVFYLDHKPSLFQRRDPHAIDALMLGLLGVVDRLREETAATETSCRCPDHGTWVNAADVYPMVRALDVALNGIDGAAKQALLCDLVAQVEAAQREHGPILPVLAWAAPRVAALGEEYRELADRHSSLQKAVGDDACTPENVAEAKKQWDTVAALLGVNGDDVDAVMEAAAKAGRGRGHADVAPTRLVLDWDGNDLLVCDGDHPRGEKCRYVRYTAATAKAPDATAAGG